MTSAAPFRYALMALAAACAGTAANAVELDSKSVVFKTPDQFVWADPTDKVETNRTVLYGDPDKPGLYIYINKFKPNRFGNPHFHPNDRFITVIDGAGWKGTGTVVDPSHAVRLPKGSFMIDHAQKIHWDGTKEEPGAYFIVGYGPVGNTPVPKTTGSFTELDTTAVTALSPDKIEWKDNGVNKSATLIGDPTKPGLYIQMTTWYKGNFSHPHFHPNDRFITVLAGTWWVGTGNKWDPANLTVPMKPGTFVTDIAKGVHWDGAKNDEEATILIVGEGPATNTRVEETK